MIDIVLWRSTIGCFYSKFKYFVGYSAFEKGMLHTALNKWLNVAVLHVKCMLYLALSDCFDLAMLHLGILMMLLHCSGYLEAIGYFNLKFNCYIGSNYTNNETGMHAVLHDFTVLHVKGMLYRSLNDHSDDFTVLHIAVLTMYVIFMLLLCSGDIELNPGPSCYVMCPNCNVQVHIKKKTCECGYRLFKKCGRLATGCPVGTTRDAGFSASTGHPTADVDIEMNVPSGCPVGTT